MQNKIHCDTICKFDLLSTMRNRIVKKRALVRKGVLLRGEAYDKRRYCKYS